MQKFLTMSHKSKLRFCNVTLPVFSLLILFSGLHLEITACASIHWVCLHIALGILFTALILWHIRLHLHWSQLRARLLHSPHRHLRLLSILALLVIFLAILATLSRLFHGYHTPIGGLHGKCAFLFLLFLTAHVIRRHHYYHTLFSCPPSLVFLPPLC